MGGLGGEQLAQRGSGELLLVTGVTEVGSHCCGVGHAANEQPGLMRGLGDEAATHAACQALAFPFLLWPLCSQDVNGSVFTVWMHALSLGTSKHRKVNVPDPGSGCHPGDPHSPTGGSRCCHRWVSSLCHSVPPEEDGLWLQILF